MLTWKVREQEAREHPGQLSVISGKGVVFSHLFWGAEKRDGL